MSTSERVILGCIGAMLPILANLLILDLHETLKNPDWILALSYSIRVLVLCAIGAIIAYVYDTETNKFKILQLGLAAPALLSTMIAGASAQRAPIQNQSAPQKASSRTGQESENAFYLIGRAYAQDATSDTAKKPDLQAKGPEPSKSASVPVVNSLPAPDYTIGEKIALGLFGIRPAPRYFVTAGSFKSKDDAEQAIKQFEDSNSEKSSVKLYMPDKDSGIYSAIIGSNLKFDEAFAVNKAAKSKGFDSSIWNGLTTSEAMVSHDIP